jgi:hypothetical protein
MNLHKKEKDLLLESCNIQHEQIKMFFAEHPFQPLDALPYDARLYERKTMNDSVPRKWLTYNKETKRLYCSYRLAFECPNTCNPSPFVLGFSDYRRISQSLPLHESTTKHVRNAQQYISVVNDGTLDKCFVASLIKKKEAQNYCHEDVEQVSISFSWSQQ